MLNSPMKAIGAAIARRFVSPPPYRGRASVLRSTDESVTLRRTRSTSLSHTMRLVRRGEGPVLGPVVSTTLRTVTRAAQGPIAPGAWGWDSTIYSKLCEASGCQIDGQHDHDATNSVHVVHVHGQSMGPQQTLRGVRPWTLLGASSSIVALEDLSGVALNSVAAERVRLAVDAARLAGAQTVVIQSWSAGIQPAMSAIESGVEADALVAIAPVIHIERSLVALARSMHLPASWSTEAALQLSDPAAARALGLPSEVQTMRTFDANNIPVLTLRATADSLASATPDVLTGARTNEVLFAHAPHTLEWNEDPERWEQAVTDFARSVL